MKLPCWKIASGPFGLPLPHPAAASLPGYQLDLENIAPEFTGDKQSAIADVIGGLPGYAVEHSLGAAGGGVIGEQGEIDDACHRSALRIDADNLVGLPDVGLDFAVDVFEFVQIGDWISLPLHVHRALHCECLGIKELQFGCAIAEDQMGAVPGQPPTLRRIIVRCDGLERLEIVHKDDVGLPGQLIDFVFNDSEDRKSTRLNSSH